MKSNRPYLFRMLLAFALLVCCNPFSNCKAQGYTYNPEDKFSVEQLTTDFTYFRGVLEKAHPSLYRYLPKDTVDACFDSALARLTKPITELEFWDILQSAISRLGSGHTSIALSLAAYNFNGGHVHNYLPFDIFIRDNRIFIRDYTTLSNVSFDIGDEVLAIDGKSSAQILQKLRSLTPGEGYSKAFKDSKLESEYFMWIFSTVYGEKKQYVITFNTNGLIKDKTLNSAQRFYWRQPVTPVNISSVERFQINNDAGPILSDSIYHQVSYPANLPSTVVLKINSFVYSDYYSFHRKLFKQLKKNQVQNLVIDLRNNGGGEAKICMDLLTYLSAKKNQFMAYCEGVVDYNRFVALLNAYQPISLSDIQHSLYRLKFAVNDIQSPDANHFTGKIFILTNGGTYSAAALLAVAVKKQVDCTIIGQETGGGLAGTDGMSLPIVTLPETHLRLTMPLQWGYSMSRDENEGHGLMPDIELIPNAKQILDLESKGIDACLLKVGELIGAK